jgi:hypothetical protein
LELLFNFKHTKLDVMRVSTLVGLKENVDSIQIVSWGYEGLTYHPVSPYLLRVSGNDIVVDGLSLTSQLIKKR